MTNFSVVVTTINEGKNFGVGFICDDQLIRHFSGITESLANDTQNFCNSVVIAISEGKILLPLDKFPQVVQISEEKFYATLTTNTIDGTEWFFTSKAIENKTDANFICAVCHSAIDFLGGVDGEKIPI